MRPLGLEPIAVAAPLMEAATALEEIGDMAESLFLLNAYLFGAGEKAGAALAVTLANGIRARVDALRPLLMGEPEVGP